MKYEVKKRAHYQPRFDGSRGLFNACWNQFQRYRREGAIDEPQDDEDVMQWLDEIAAEKVNNPQSRFWIYG